MPSIDQRLRKIEEAIKEKPQRPPTKAEQVEQDDAMFARYGLTRDEVMTKYGGAPGLAYAAMLGEVRPLNYRPPPPEPDDGLSPQERYMRMLDG